MNAFRRISKKISYFQTILLLTIIYVVVVPFFALLLIVFKGKRQRVNSWSTWRHTADSLEDVRRQF